MHSLTTAPRLGPEHNLPLTAPFTRLDALACGVSDRRLATLTAFGLIKHPLLRVYHASQLLDSIDLRIACLKLVVPEDAVITDRTAAWLHGAQRVLAPGDHLVVPRVSAFLPPGNGRRLRNELAASGERTFLPEDVMTVEGLRVTTPVRTCCDVGRLLARDQALGVMDALMRACGFEVLAIMECLPRYKGARGVVQLRELAPLIDGRSQSPGEGALRLRWLDAGLPKPELQLPVQGPKGTCYLDLGLPDLLFAGEYDGEEFHGDEQTEHDLARRTFLIERGGWIIVVARRKNVYGRLRDIDNTLMREFLRAQKTHVERRARTYIFT